jgi:DmsE family decaheme c-type cytochrome
MAAPSEDSGIVSFKRDSKTGVEEQNRMCLACHSTGGRMHWGGSAHEAEDLACSDCHNPMAKISPRGLLRESTVSRTCFTCHPQQRTEFRKRSHMPLLEGKISCVDCHEPHGSITDPLLRGDSVNQLCYGCHAEKRGPFLWEHAPVRESCLNCHRPHGSNHERLLVAPMPFLCQSCHGQIGLASHVTSLLTRGNLSGGAAPDERLLNRSCANCHAQIHGSNHPSGVRFHR